MSRQLEIPGVPAGENTGGWCEIYGRIRRDGTRVSVVIPPKRDSVMLRVGTRRVFVEHSEVPRIAEAFAAAMEHIRP